MVASDSAPSDSLPQVFRVSDEERDEVIRMLRDGSVDGRISNETFLRRVDRALHARGADELAELLADLPRVPDENAAAVSWRVSAAAWLRELRLRWPRVRVAMGPPQPPPLALPRARAPCSPSAARPPAIFPSAT